MANRSLRRRPRSPETTWCHIPSPHGRLRRAAINWAAHFHLTSRTKSTTNVALLFRCLRQVYQQRASRIKKNKASNGWVSTNGQHAILTLSDINKLISMYCSLYFYWRVGQIRQKLQSRLTCFLFSSLIKIIYWISIGLWHCSVLDLSEQTL